MIDLADFLWSFSLISLLLHLLPVVTAAISMARSSNSPSSSAYPPTWVRQRSTFFSPKGVAVASMDLLQESLSSFQQDSSSEGTDFVSAEYPQPNSPSQKCLQGNSCYATAEHPEENSRLKRYLEENSCFGTQNLFKNDLVFATREEYSEVSSKEGLVSSAKVPRKVRKRPAGIVIPETNLASGFDEVSGNDLGENELQVQGRDFCLASKKGKKKVMEDSYSVITDISGDSTQAFFGVFDGHGGRAAVEHVTEKLGNNILTFIEKADRVEQAIKGGYLTTDKEFLSQGKSSGACAATVLLKDGELHVANVGDCRVVLSRKGAAIALTNDHNVGREDERLRIENSGGYVHCHNGVWRVQGSHAVSRAIGDVHLKEWILSEPEINKLPLTSDCEFFIVASDGLWDKVTNQEAVDVVMRHNNSMESCKMLVEISLCRGNKDDITVMVVDLKNFRRTCG